GLNPHYLATHIAWDIGAGALTRQLSRDLNAVAVLAKYSRLLIDTNRSLDDPSLMVEASEGKEVPGNFGLPLEERQRRVETYYEPFHEACDAVIEPRLSQKPIVTGIHTFTPIYEGIKRPWEISLMWNEDDRLAKAMGKYFEGEGFHVGWNQPYSGRDLFCTMDRHGARHGLLHATLEVRQDLVQDKKGQELFGRLVAAAFQKVYPEIS
ncbi:MAG TPA: N-formylglutamate amidohydrolase, partial [Sphingomonadales bacterium]|nr:N-formylglutamate amidohydrolase [Sphingomonadales bacterium]